ncbi:prephenate dehydrogenase [Flavobacterium agricola]|uniref:Prephenate dehydrogenase n=1 Tax=Flavobacterium agricola TaxID=2870839 RepID=A0ABY6M592_9FLAO|nr:prephenate dehydrogenase [Flavobacterium agricola]UYW02498.1 prephenate dehydrogenase [Flavobacterium agricola]
MKTVTIIGLGLIGGSFALGLKRTGLAEKIIGVDTNPEHCQEALALGIVDEIKELKPAVLQSDLVILAIPINAAQVVLPQILDYIPLETYVMDMGSTKAGICAVVKNHPNRKNFVATHPIAGTENSGPKAAFAELFLNKVSIICDAHLSSEKAVNLVRKIYQNLWTNVITMSAEAHDEHIAYVSHLSHITSFALGQTVLEIEKDEKNIFDMAGSGFESTVRLAKSSPAMWTPIFIQNRENLLKAIDTYEKQIQKMREMIENSEAENIYEYLSQVNDIRRILNK